MRRRVQLRLRHLAVPALLVLGVLLTACSSTAEAPKATASPPASPTATATPTATLTPRATPTPTATPTPVATPAPRYDDVIASTTLLPLEELDRVTFTSGAGPAPATATLAIEVPPRREYGIGLSGRYQLADRGMLFFYPEGNRGGFWMRNTHIDLDIAFIDAELRIIDILQMEADTETTHRPDRLYIAAIEAPLGWYEAASIAPGASVEFLFDVEATTAAANAAADAAANAE